MASLATRRMPSVFVGHGAPTVAITSGGRGEELRVWGDTIQRTFGKPSAIVAVSAHWEASRVAIGETGAHAKLLYDIGGFPDAMYRVQYPAPGPSPTLLTRLRDLLRGSGIAFGEEPSRKIDHGLWSPLVRMLPDHDIPLVQLAMPHGGDDVFALGRALAPLRDEGVLLLGSGNATHNFAMMNLHGTTAPQADAIEFHNWVRDTASQSGGAELLRTYAKQRTYKTNHPSDDHWLPILFAAGAALPSDQATAPIDGFEFGSLSKLCIQWSGSV